MTRLIDADKLIESLRKTVEEARKWMERLRTDPDSPTVYEIYADRAIVDFTEVKLRIESMPTVDAQLVRHGKWDYVTVVDEGFWRCSSCGTPSEASGAKVLYKYCPFCGAKMDATNEH